MTNEEYSQIDALNYSSFKHFLISPNHYKIYRNTVQEETAAMRLGTAIHSAVLTPTEFVNDYTYAPEVDRRTREGKAIWEEFTANNPDKIILKRDEFDICIGSSEAAHSNNCFRKFSSSPKAVKEQAVVGDMFGVKIKGRIDLYDEETNTIVDLKSMSFVPTVDNCKRAIFQNMYHIQCVFYSELIKQKYNRVPDFIFAFIEKSNPYSMGFIRLNSYTKNIAYNVCEKEFSRYANCKLLDLWPSFDHSEIPETVSIWNEPRTTETVLNHIID
jgi:exodeoxyribonuclease VIII